MTNIEVRPMAGEDWPAVEAIYREGIDTGNATFEAEPPSWDVSDAGKLRVGRLVVLDMEGSIAGWVAASPVSVREVYRGVVEHSIYIADHARGQGIGRKLLDVFLRDVDNAGIWTVQSSIFPDNPASLTLHEHAGFRRVGHRERIARMTYGPWAGQWRDTILIERRRAE